MTAKANRGSRARNAFACITAACCLGAFAWNALAASGYTNSASGNWSLSGNWTGSPPPAGGASSAAILFQPSSGVLLATNDLSGAFSVNQVSASGNAVSLYGNPIAFVSNGSIGPLVTNSSGNPLNLFTPVTLGANTTFGAADPITNNGVITGNGSLTKTGSGVLALATTNNYSGNTTVSGGTLRLVAPGSIYDAAWNNSAIVTLTNNALLAFDGWAYGPANSFGDLDFGSSRIVLSGGTLRCVAAGGASGGRSLSVGPGGGTLDSSVSAKLWTIGADVNYPSVTIGGLLTLTGAGNGEIDKNITGAGGVTVNGSGTWTLTFTNTFNGPTTVNAGVLALNGSGSISNTPMISLGGGAAFDVSRLVIPFVLGINQTVSNRGSATGILNGPLNASSGTVSVSYASGTPAFTITNGNLTLSLGTVFNLTNTGTALAPGSYKIIARASVGNVGAVAGTAPAVNLNVGGLATNASAALQIIGRELYLVVALPGSGLTNIFVAEDTNTVIWKNPGKGWVYYGTSFPTWLPASQQAMVNVVYNRWHWWEIEPSENVFNWSLIDNAINSAKANGVKFAFGVMNCDVGNYAVGNAPYTSVPKWAFDAGAGYYVVGTNGYTPQTNYVPYWTTNPVFLAKMDAFITALGQRYNGNTNLAFIDIRTFGNWGEGHLGGISTANNGQIIASPSIGEMETNYFQPYLNAFPNTQLIIPWGSSGYGPAYTWAVQQGAGMRRDGIPDWNDGSNITFASGHGPAVIEYTDSYDNLVAEGLWTNSVVCADILRAKASYSQISWSSDFLNNFSNSMAGIENQMGYHFVLTNMTLPLWLTSASSNATTLNWVNRGVTFLYEPCSVALALLDGGNNVIGKSWLVGVNPQRNWAPGPVAVASTMSFNAVPAGSYQLAVGLFTSTNQAQPNFKLGNLGRTANGWYGVAHVLLHDIPQPATNPTNLTGAFAAGVLTLSWPLDHLGWTLQAQTNALGTNWVRIANSATTNQLDIPIMIGDQAGFYRLTFP